MKRYINILSGLLLASLALAAMSGLTGCSDDDTGPVGSDDQGVVFKFSRTEGIKYFDGDFEIDDIRYLKAWITDASGNKHELPTLEMYGEGDTVSSAPCSTFMDGSPIPAGTYKLFEMWVYRKATEAPFEQMQPTKNNGFQIVSGEVTRMEIPLKFVIILSTNPLNNLLMWICKEAIGDDESLWPWDLSKEIETYQDLYGWDYLQLDIESGIVYGILGFDFYDKKEPGKVSPWANMEELPSAITGLVETYFISVRDLPNFKRLNKNVDELHVLRALHIVNTGFEGFPDEFFNVGGAIDFMSEIRVSDCPNFTTIPPAISNFKNLVSLHITGNPIKEVDVDFSRFKEIDVINLSDNQITSISDRVFNSENTASIVYLNGNPLPSLPAGLLQMKNLRTLQVKNMGLTSVPAQVRNPKIDILDLSDNNLSTINSGDFAGMSSLENLYLDKNPLTSINIVSDAVKYIGFDNCGLTAFPNLGGVKNIRGLSMRNNSFSNITIDMGVAANGTEHLRFLDLDENSSLKTLNITEKGGTSTFPSKFRYLMVNTCPSLNWTAPAAWNPKDYSYTQTGTDENGETKEYVINPLIVISPGDDIIEGETEVFIDRRGSTGVKLQ